jgi:hypothetical protein
MGRVSGTLRTDDRVAAIELAALDCGLLLTVDASKSGHPGVQTRRITLRFAGADRPARVLADLPVGSTESEPVVTFEFRV